MKRENDRLDDEITEYVTGKAVQAEGAQGEREICFRKKPVVIQAIRWTGENLRQIITFTDGPPDTRSMHAGMMWENYERLVAEQGLKIYTLEGKMSAAVGDWIIKGVKGEHYPCKPDVFEQTYERVDTSAVPQRLLRYSFDPHDGMHDDENGQWVRWEDLSRAALAQPSPAPELERPEVVAYLNEWRHRDQGGIRVTPALSAMSEEGLQKEYGPRASVVRREPLMTVAQHERILRQALGAHDDQSE